MDLFCVIARGENDTIVSFKTFSHVETTEFTCVICLSGIEESDSERIQLKDTCSPLYKYASVVYHEGDNVKTLCSHVFHTECIYKWFDEQKRVVCPLCISEIPIEELYQLYVEKPELITTRWDNGTIKEKYYVSRTIDDNRGEGIKCGSYEYYVETGQLQRRCNYNELGLKDGLEIEYYPFSGKIRSHINWKNGELDGRFWVKNCKGWWQCKGMYKDGRLHGNLKKWHPKKRVLHISCTYIEGKKHGKSMEWFDNGQLRKYVIYNQDKISGLYLEYYANSVLKKRCFIENGNIYHGMYVEYFETGALKTKRYYHHGTPIHYSEKWHSNGNMASYQEYLLVADSAGGGGKWVKNGIWKKWSRNGSIMSWIPYENGKLNGCGARFDEDGNPIEGAEYKNNVINGIYCSYYPQNKIHWICNFENGVLSGESLQYDRYGNHLLTLRYKDNKLHGECIDHVTHTSCEYYMGIKK